MRKKKKDDVVACVMAFIPRGWGGGGVGLRYRLGLEVIQMQLLLCVVRPQISKFTFITLIICSWTNQIKLLH